MRSAIIALVAACGIVTPAVRAADTPVPLARGVRGLITRAPSKITVDGSLREWDDAFCTPVHYNHQNLANRAAQFFYLWDDEAFYIGLRCLDQKQANPAPLDSTYDGDAVEFYLDTRAGDALRGKDWTAGAIRFFFSPFQAGELKPRWVMRGGIATSDTKLNGVQLAATRDAVHYDVEFKVPWLNFPDFAPRLGALLALDAELCSADGAGRTDRTFAYGSPLSVEQPASLGKVELVKRFDPDYFETAGPSAFPFWVDTPWNQAGRAQVVATVAIPPAFLAIVGAVEVRLHDADGKIVKTVPARIEGFGPIELRFSRAQAAWSIDDFAPGTYFATARVLARTGKPLTTVAPRMVQEAIIQGR
ncbi:MAG: sugar-binding protein [Isosphaeraceae bacterium]|nr:sugar-binding protein [Isosphaeraceae bacterium]